MDGGKRLRPVMMRLAYEAAGGSCGVLQQNCKSAQQTGKTAQQTDQTTQQNCKTTQQTGQAAQKTGKNTDLLPFQTAIELIHNYSLVHDDLPSMDNDALRHGKPSAHKKFGEGNAVLIGDAMLNLALEILMRQGSAAAALHMARCARDMITGQWYDLNGHNSLDELYALKTGALFQAAAYTGSLLAGKEDKALLEYAVLFGRVFQIADDILDATSTQEVLGKPINSDKEQGKTTYITLYGIEGARAEMDSIIRRVKAMNVPPELLQLIQYAKNRAF